jgi:hypothetical protein
LAFKGLCDTMFSKCDLFSEVPVLAVSGVVDTCSISTGDGWIRIGKRIRGNIRGGGHMFHLDRVSTTNNRLGKNGFGLRFVIGSNILSKVQELGCV